MKVPLGYALNMFKTGSEEISQARQLAGDRKLRAGLFRYGGEPAHRLSWFGSATRGQRELSVAVFALALDEERLPPDLEELGPTVLWTLHMGLLFYLLFDGSPGQARTRRLTDGALDLVVSVRRVAVSPLLRPLRRKVLALLREAGLLPAAVPPPPPGAERKELQP
jgi:hypothetical protein